MTKEEILGHLWFYADKKPPSTKEVCVIEHDEALKAMEQYAKQQVIAYELWINEMLMDDSSFNYDKTAEQLYDLFFEHQKQQSV